MKQPMLKPEDGATFHGGIEKRGGLFKAWCRAELEAGGRWSAESREWGYNLGSEEEAIAWIDRRCAERRFEGWTRED
jgi:hypothetical protein